MKQIYRFITQSLVIVIIAAGSVEAHDSARKRALSGYTELTAEVKAGNNIEPKEKEASAKVKQREAKIKAKEDKQLARAKKIAKRALAEAYEDELQQKEKEQKRLSKES